LEGGPEVLKCKTLVAAKNPEYTQHHKKNAEKKIVVAIWVCGE